MNEWKEYRLGDIIEIVNGGTPKTSIPEYWDGDIPWLSVVDFNHGFKYVSCTEKSITEKGLKNSSTNLLNKGDIILSARGTVGILSVLKKTMAFNQSCYGIKALKEYTFNNFLYYLLDFSIVYLKQIVHGGVFDTITRRTFYDINILLPPLSEQKAIASILGSLDDKIDLLHRQNKTLEAMAEALFRQWFIEEARDEWEEVKLGEYVNTINGVSYRSAELQPSSTAMVTLKSFNREGGFNEEGYKEYIGLYKKDHILHNGDILIAHTDITQNAEVIGNPIFMQLIQPYTTIIFSMDLVKIENTNQILSNPFLYYLTKHRNFKEHCLGYTNGTTVLHLNKKAVLNFTFRIPPKPLEKRFTTIVSHYLDKQCNNKTQIRNLKKIRDTLLPKLISGEVRVM